MTTFATAALVLHACTALRRRLKQQSPPEKELANGHVRLTALWNHGAAFGLPIPPKVLQVFSAATMVLVWLFRQRAPLGAGLILGGGISNLLERFVNGRVFDYLRFPKLPGRLKHTVFNLADLAVFTGAVLLCFSKKRS